LELRIYTYCPVSIGTADIHVLPCFYSHLMSYKLLMPKTGSTVTGNALGIRGNAAIFRKGQGIYLFPKASNKALGLRSLLLDEYRGTFLRGRDVNPVTDSYLAAKLRVNRSIHPISRMFCGVNWTTIPFFIEGPRSRCYGRTATLRLIVQPWDEDD
jgi:hypothetical protein